MGHLTWQGYELPTVGRIASRSRELSYLFLFFFFFFEGVMLFTYSQCNFETVTMIHLPIISLPWKILFTFIGT